jgi:hypothetical protein
MPARDLYHDAVKAALIKNNWAILADPYRIQYKDVDLSADLAAERPLAVEREGQKIVVEIKSFVGRSLMTDFHLAVGQYRSIKCYFKKLPLSLTSTSPLMTLPTATSSNVKALNF